MSGTRTIRASRSEAEAEVTGGSEVLVINDNYNESQRHAPESGQERNNGFTGGIGPQGPADSNKNGGGR